MQTPHGLYGVGARMQKVSMLIRARTLSLVNASGFLKINFDCRGFVGRQIVKPFTLILDGVNARLS